MATYGGGGYVAELGTYPQKSRDILDRLITVGWVDYYTRAVFFELSVYNANANLFAFISYGFEFPVTGGVMMNRNIETLRLYSALGGMGTAVLVAQLVYVVILIYFIVRVSRILTASSQPEYDTKDLLIL